MKIFVYSAHAYEIPFLQRLAEGKHELVFTEKKLTLDTAQWASGCEAVALFTADDASAPVIQKLHAFGIRFIALRSAGYDHVDLAKAEKLGISVANVPAYSPYAIAEHAVALLLALNRRITEAQTLMRLQDFRLDTLVGFDIHGKTVGIIGTGTIGMAFVKIMKGFGARLIGYDPVKNKEAEELGLQYVSLDELFKSSDIISIHCPLNEHTRYLISKPQLEKMKKNAILINTSRGGIVNTEDLLEALESGRLGGACLDVYEKEKSLFFEDHRNSTLKDVLFTRLRSNKNVIVTGHQAFLTTEALQGIAGTTIENIDYWEDGQTSPHELNKVAKVANVN
ncbi:2-hydroxyacid dehydrogenase [Chryseosolibacter indicus]|uniref:2-hydroxyacid dehydrogenase n=1 Tax=Chryseosolibacter indicus TaxID=2782351 RepID=A0ABS5VRS4_9BACT|nr:2-hydroxyacid dehydrogenase [Chryseosolibacter indicus]MBT1703733.1 2-hydroxyacid dehydrogenase [Chryseosolibacter indicus]